MSNPYDVERSWPDYFLEHRRLTVEKQGTYGCGDRPVWTVHCPLGLLGNSTIIEGDDGLIIYDTGVNAEERSWIPRTFITTASALSQPVELPGSYLRPTSCLRTRRSS